MHFSFKKCYEIHAQFSEIIWIFENFMVKVPRTSQLSEVFLRELVGHFGHKFLPKLAVFGLSNNLDISVHW